MKNRSLKLLSATLIMSLFILGMPAATYAASPCKKGENYYPHTKSVSKEWYRTGKTVSEATSGIRFTSSVKYYRCYTAATQRTTIQSATITWKAIKPSSKKFNWSCKAMGDISKVQINPDSIAGNNYGTKTWNCSAASGSKSYDFANRTYVLGKGGQERCLGGNVTLVRDGVNIKFAMPKSCV